MRSEDDLRAALRTLEPPRTMLRHVAERVGHRTDVGAGGRRKGGRLLAAAGAAAGVIAIVAAAALVANHGRSWPSASAAPTAQGVPRYYLAVEPSGPKFNSPDYASARDVDTGRTLATVQPPKPYVTFISVTGAADDRTFVLTAQSATASNPGTRIGFFEARFNPADNKLTLSPLALRGIPGAMDLAGAALSPDGRQLAVASQTGPGPAQVAVYSLPGGAIRAWRATGDFANTDVDLLTWGSAGTLAFSWGGSATSGGSSESSLGLWLLSTRDNGGALFQHSRQPFCSMHGYGNVPYAGYLVPDGRTVIIPVPAAVSVGQRSPCPRVPALPPSPTARSVLEGFSTTTGQALGVVATRASHVVVGDIWWSNPSGGVLVVNASARPRGTDRFGVLSGDKFTPIPGAPSMGPDPTMLAF
jgi:hypothetical protein